MWPDQDPASWTLFLFALKEDFNTFPSKPSPFRFLGGIADLLLNPSGCHKKKKAVIASFFSVDLSKV